MAWIDIIIDGNTDLVAGRLHRDDRHRPAAAVRTANEREQQPLVVQIEETTTTTTPTACTAVIDQVVFLRDILLASQSESHARRQPTSRRGSHVVLVDVDDGGPVRGGTRPASSQSRTSQFFEQLFLQAQRRHEEFLEFRFDVAIGTSSSSSSVEKIAEPIAFSPTATTTTTTVASTTTTTSVSAVAAVHEQ